METSLLTLSKIFTERLFRIPDYQRGYSWTNLQLQDFWSDIAQLSSKRNHYTGVLTLELIPRETLLTWVDDLWVVEAKNYEPFYVVDGQQRLTTSIILIQSIIENISDGVKLNYTDKNEIIRKFIYDSKDNGISKSYIFGYEKDNPSYEFLKREVYNDFSSSCNVLTTIYAYNLEYAKAFFKEKMEDFTIRELEILYSKITQQLLFNIFIISNDVDVCVAFETMNNRGKPLSYLELLKNRLIYLSLIIDADDADKYALRKSINDCWKSIYHNLGCNKDNPLSDDKFLTSHYFIYFYNDVKAFDEREIAYRLDRGDKAYYTNMLLKKIFIPNNINSNGDDPFVSLTFIHDYVNSLQKSVECWYFLNNPYDASYSVDVKNWLYKLNRIGCSQFLPLMLVFFMEEDSSKIRLSFLKAIERALFIQSISRYRSISLLFYNANSPLTLAHYLKSKKISSMGLINRIHDSSSKEYNFDHYKKSLDSRFSSEGFYSWTGLKYFLYEYNLHLQEQSKTSRAKIDWSTFCEYREDYFTIEHIYPKQARSTYWTSRFSNLTTKKKKALRESLGNLLPLSRAKNSSLSNKPFPEKVQSPLHPSVGYRYGSYAENEVTKCEEWTPITILQRGLVLMHFMENRWNIKLGGKQDKLHILGLQFMDTKPKE